MFFLARQKYLIYVWRPFIIVNYRRIIVFAFQLETEAIPHRYPSKLLFLVPTETSSFHVQMINKINFNFLIHIFTQKSTRTSICTLMTPRLCGMHEWTGGWMDGRAGGWTNWWTDGWMDGCDQTHHNYDILLLKK